MKGKIEIKNPTQKYCIHFIYWYRF